MNLKIHTIISDIDGKTGIAIIEAICAGERNPERLADLRDPRIKASREELIKSLTGIWSEEHLFTLKQCYKLYQYHDEMIMECDKKIAAMLQSSAKLKNGGLTPALGKVKQPTLPNKQMRRRATVKRTKQSAQSNNAINDFASDIDSSIQNYLNGLVSVRDYLTYLNGVDVTTIPGIGEDSAMTIYSEIGSDMSKWTNAKHFASWTGTVPNTKISSVNVISSHVPKTKNRVGQVFRMAVLSLRFSNDPLGAYYRKMRATVGKYKAVVATVHKMAIIYYNMMISKQIYNPEKLKEYQKKQNEYKTKRLEKTLEKLKTVV
jgi:hypothetical protein